MSEHDLPAWSLPAEAATKIALQSSWPAAITRDWAYGDSTGAGAKVCILDSGVEAGHPLVGEVQHSFVVSVGEDGEARVDEDDEGDLAGHGTACAGIVRSFAPDCELTSAQIPATCGVAKLLPVHRIVSPPSQATSTSTPRAKNSTGGLGL